MMKIEGIVLAAGLSSRAGTNKLILDVGGKTVIERCIDGMYDICSRIIVVSGHRAGEIEYILNKYSKVELVYNANYLEGMFSSVKEGLRHIKEDRFFLIPGDHPVVGKSVYNIMEKSDGDILVPLYRGRKGHPILMKSSLIIELLRDSSCYTLRDFIHKRGFTRIDVEEPGILMDIDTMGDYEKILSHIV